MSRARPTATRDRRASPRESRVVNSRASRAVARAVARCGLLLLLLRPNIRYIRRIIRTQSTITTWITRGIVCVTLCVHTRMSEFSTDAASRRIHRSVGTGRRARRRDASDAVRSSAIRADSRRERFRAASTGTPTVARRPRVDRDDAVAVPTARWIRGDADGRRRRDGVDACRQWTRFEDSTSRAYTARARGIQRDALIRRRATEDPSRARGARGRARDDEGRRGEEE